MVAIYAWVQPITGYWNLGANTVCLNVNIFQTPHSLLVILDFCYKCVVPKPMPRQTLMTSPWHHQGYFPRPNNASSELGLQNLFSCVECPFKLWVGVPIMPCLCLGILVKGLLTVGCVWLLDLIQHNCVQGLRCYSFAIKDDIIFSDLSKIPRWENWRILV